MYTRLAAALDAHAYADSGRARATRALAELARTQPKGGRCGGVDANGEDKMSLSFVFVLFGEIVYAKGSHPLGRSIA